VIEGHVSECAICSDEVVSLYTEGQDSTEENR
jgi:hypothetical protein